MSPPSYLLHKSEFWEDSSLWRNTLFSIFAYSVYCICKLFSCWAQGIRSSVSRDTRQHDMPCCGHSTTATKPNMPNSVNVIIRILMSLFVEGESRVNNWLCSFQSVAEVWHKLSKLWDCHTFEQNGSSKSHTWSYISRKNIVFWFVIVFRCQRR